MITKLSIRNFKSIRELKIDCRRINLFIGEPNTGKSNILEALGVLSWFGHGDALTEYVRLQNAQEFFYDGRFIDESVEIGIDIGSVAKIDANMKFQFQNNEFLFSLEAHLENGVRATAARTINYSGEFLDGAVSGAFPDLKFIKPYTFKQQKDFQGTYPSFLMPPHGSNMFAVVMSNKRLRELVSQFFENFGFKLLLKPQERTFEILKQEQDVVFSYPYMLSSDTLQRMIFHTVAIESNEDSTLIFEEPEAHAFPYYTGHLGEKIALDGKNQYFIATHNPYFLLSILEKAPKGDVNVFITYFRDYQTKVRCVNDEEIPKLMRYDPFFNLDSFIEEAGE